MKKIGDGIADFITSAGGADGEALKSRRIVEVNSRWRSAVESVYREAATLVLDHVNAVYIMRPDEVEGGHGGVRVVDGGTALVVYCDDSTIRADLDARQELIKMKLNKQGERVETFRLLSARGAMRARHPFRDEEQRTCEGASGVSASPKRAVARRALTASELKKVETYVEKVEDPALKKIIAKAIAADFQSKCT